MLKHNYLAVQSVRLEEGDVWEAQGSDGGLFFFFLSEGEGEYADEKLRCSLRKGSMLVSTQKSGRGRLLAKWPGMVFRCFSLQMEQLFPLFDAGQLSMLEDVVGRFDCVRVYSGNSLLAKECHRLLNAMPDESDLARRAQVLAIVARILSEQFEAARSRRPGFFRIEERMQRVFESLSREEFLRLSVPELASKFGCSRRHLTRLFHNYFGTSIADFRMELRLMKVASLLRNPNVKITNIAEECGFNQLGYFNACFKRRFGLSPSQWRKQIPESSPVATANELPRQSFNGSLDHSSLRLANPQAGKPAGKPVASVLAQFGQKKPLTNASSLNSPSPACMADCQNSASKPAFELIENLGS